MLDIKKLTENGRRGYGITAEGVVGHLWAGTVKANSTQIIGDQFYINHPNAKNLVLTFDESTSLQTFHKDSEVVTVDVLKKWMKAHDVVEINLCSVLLQAFEDIRNERNQYILDDLAKHMLEKLHMWDTIAKLQHDHLDLDEILDEALSPFY